jgi:hypothetical protein
LNVLELLTIAGGAIGVAAGLVGYYGKARGDSIIKYQATELSLRDGTISRQREDLAAVTAERDALKRQNVDLVGLAQGSPELAKVAEQIKELAIQVSRVAKRGETP